MSSLVSEFIINPVLRQARRFSEASRNTLSGGGDDTNDERPDDVIDSEHSSDDTTQTREDSPESSNLRPLSSSTEDTRVEETMPTETMSTQTTPLVIDGGPRDHLGFPLPKRKNSAIPEDDGMRELRGRIQAIHAREIEPPEKARLMHDLLLESYKASRSDPHAVKTPEPPSSPVSQRVEQSPVPQGALDTLKFWHNQVYESPGPAPAEFTLTEKDKAPSFAPPRRTKHSGLETPSIDPTITPTSEAFPELGCQHYERNVKLQCSQCDRWYPCRLCHDNVEDHKLPRFETKYMLCMFCTTPQKVSDTCINCGELSARYYCGICKLWENRQSRPIYHCGDCGICRRGMGLGKDYVHCKTCCVCIPTSMETSHKCIERSTDCNCPICGEYMFSSPRPVVFMTCGHSIHKKCYGEHMKVSYKCPICNKSLANMETQFRNLDVAIQGQPMPPEFRDTKAVILCNDCSARSTVPYHWLGLKCSICRSYNTAELRILGGAGHELQPGQVDTGDEPAVRGVTQPILAAPVDGDVTEGVAIAGRRRYSSRGIEVQRRASDIIAGSFPPFSMRYESTMGQIPSDSESEGGMLGFWGGGDEDEEEDDDEESDFAEDSGDEAEDDDDDDDLLNDLILIGHR